MNNQKIISLEEFNKVVNESANELRTEFPNLNFDYAGIIPVKDETFRYDSSPTNTKVFATTGGDGVHYSILEVSEKIQPVVMTVPMNFGHSIKDYNLILGENLNEFLSLGFYNGWFPLEQLYYNNEWAIKFYLNENQEEDYQPDGNIQFVKKLRTKIGYKHVLLSNKRLKELEESYFMNLEFDLNFMKKT